MVLDFFGLPGSGKSKVSHALGTLLREDGKNVAEISYEMDHNNVPWKRFVLKLWYSILFTIANQEIAKKIKELVKECGYLESRGYTSQLINLLYKMYLLNKRKLSIAIFDEGLAQASVSLSIDSRLNARDVYKRIMSICADDIIIIPIYLETKIENAFHNMSLRKTKNSRVEKMHEEIEKQKFMTEYQKQINTIEDIAEIKISIQDATTIDEIVIQLKSNLYSCE